MKRGAFGKRRKSPTSATMVTAERKAKGKDGSQPRALFGAALEIGLQTAHPLTSGVHCNSVVSEDELAGRMIEAQRLQPLQVSRRPGIDSRWCLNRLPEQELGKPG